MKLLIERFGESEKEKHTVKYFDDVKILVERFMDKYSIQVCSVTITGKVELTADRESRHGGTPQLKGRVKGDLE